MKYCGWAHLGSDQGPRSYQERALPLSHAPALCSNRLK